VHVTVTDTWTGPTTADDGAALAATEDLGERVFAAEMARSAGMLLMERYERVERIDYKSARDVVTEVDHLSEELIIGAIRGRYPTDGILAEESGEHKAGDGAPPTSGTGRVWVIDPVDGTINYANGIPFFCVSIALVVDGVPEVGVVFDPARNELFAASADGVATLNGEPITASSKEKLSDFVVQMSLSGRSVVRRARAVRKAIRITRSMGSSSLALAYVGNGRFDGFIQEGGMSNWDVAAAGLIAERAGATVTAMDGGPWYDPSRKAQSVAIVAAPAAHHEALLALTK
jgi:myo-inositol-1(or 4)-monophosphatase